MTQREAFEEWWDISGFTKYKDTAEAAWEAAQAQALHNKSVTDAEFSEWCKPTDGAAVEPVAWMTKLGDVTCFDQVRPKSVNSVPLYTEPHTVCKGAPVAWMVETERQDGSSEKWACTDKKRYREYCDFGEPTPLYTSPPDNTKAMRLALEALKAATIYNFEPYEKWVARRDAAISALEKELT